MGLRSFLSGLRNWFRSAPASAPRRIPLRLEQLEARDVPAVVVTDTYLAGLYQGFLGRVIDTNGLAFWRQQLSNTGSRVAVAEGIVHSQEYQGRELQLLYGIYLHRQLDTAGLSFWGNVLATGGTYEQVKAGIFGSQEYFFDQGSNFTNWLTAVYNSQLGRNPGQSDFTFFNSQFTGPNSLPTIASQILSSHEFHLTEMNSLYPLILGRPLDAAGSSFWVGVLDSGVSIDDVAANVVGSPEFLNNLTLFLVTNSSFTDINQAANGFFIADGLFNRVLPGVEQLNRFIPTDPTIRTTALSPGSLNVVPFGTTSPANATVTGTTGASPLSLASPFATAPSSVLSGQNFVPVNAANSVPVNASSSIPVTGANIVPVNGSNSVPVNGTNAVPVNAANSVPVNSSNSILSTGMDLTPLTGPRLAGGSFIV